MLSALRHLYGPFTQQGISSLPLHVGLLIIGTPINWAAAIEDYVCFFVRNEAHLTSDEVVTAMATAEQNKQIISVQKAVDVLAMLPQRHTNAIRLVNC